jgi:hypothetical protein
MNEDRGAFHLSNGLWFRRGPGGSVVIEHRATDGSVIHGVTTTPEGWASVVAYVSEKGEDAKTMRQALAFHGGAHIQDEGPPYSTGSARGYSSDRKGV